MLKAPTLLPTRPPIIAPAARAALPKLPGPASVRNTAPPRAAQPAPMTRGGQQALLEVGPVAVDRLVAFDEGRLELGGLRVLV